MQDMTSSTESSTNRSGWSLVLGILLMILGFLTLGSMIYTAYVSLVFIGWMLIIGGIAEFFYGFFSGSLGRAFLFFIGGILSFIIGAIIAVYPGISASTFTLLIGIFMLCVGIFNAFSSLM